MPPTITSPASQPISVAFNAGNLERLFDPFDLGIPPFIGHLKDVTGLNADALEEVYNALPGIQAGTPGNEGLNVVWGNSLRLAHTYDEVGTDGVSYYETVALNLSKEFGGIARGHELIDWHRSHMRHWHESSLAGPGDKDTRVNPEPCFPLIHFIPCMVALADGGYLNNPTLQSNLSLLVADMLFEAQGYYKKRFPRNRIRSFFIDDNEKEKAEIVYKHATTAYRVLSQILWGAKPKNTN